MKKKMEQKSKAIKAINKIMQDYHEGTCDVINALRQLREIEIFLEECFQEIKPKAIEFLESNNKSYESHNYRFSIRLRTVYDYSHIKPIRETENQIEKFERYLDGLKEIAKKGGGVDPVTGEEIPEAIIKKQDYTLIIQKINKNV